MMCVCFIFVQTRCCRKWIPQLQAAEHEATCPSARAPCRYCGLLLSHDELQEHMEKCKQNTQAEVTMLLLYCMLFVLAVCLTVCMYVCMMCCVCVCVCVNRRP